jgi:predicted phage baseplate assembly protein
MMLDTMVLGLQIGQPVIVNGELVDAEGVIGHEVGILKEIIHSRGYTMIYLEEALQYKYLRDTVIIDANVVPATHGETVNEVLGSGDGTRTNQRFVLKKPPLTYVSAATTSGAESTMNVKVDGIEWNQALSLYNIGPKSQSYVVRLDNDGNVNIEFGDGKQGTRLPTGQENIIATYRSGIGAEGIVAADSIKLLKTRPQGIRGVNNPIAASGSQEPETMDNARTNAPRTVLTMDRIVSLKDYEDFARAYAGIGKAQAVVLWNGKTEMAHLTIADSYGNTIDTGASTYQNLSKSIDTYRDHLAMVQLDTFEKRLFQIEAKLLINEKYTAEDVLKKAESALTEAFSFEKRDFGQPVTSAEVISFLQRVPGVIAVDLDKLYLTDSAYETDTKLGPTQSQPASVLPCSIARWPEGGDFQKAQLLLINPVGITLEENES